MRYISLELYGYKRFLLNRIEHFKIALTEQIQLILGTNGSGKSSLLNELTPLPASSSDYRKDGYKILVLENNGTLYHLKSSFSPKQIHSFIKNYGMDNEEEMNPGGTLSVQKELVRREFNITPDVHEMLISTRTFHAMSPAERRRWFTSLSDINYQYAISVYAKLKERLRDISGGIKLNQSRLVQETQKLLTPEQEEELKKDSETKRTTLTTLLEFKQPIKKTSSDLEEELDDLDQMIVDLSSEIIGVRNRYNFDNGFTSIEAIEEGIFNSRVKIETTTKEVAAIAKQFEIDQATLEGLTRANINSTKELDQKITVINNELDRLTRSLKFGFVFKDSSSALKALESMYDNLTTIFTDLLPNGDKRFSRANYRKLTEKKDKASSLLKELDHKIHLLNSKKKEQEHLRDHDKVECPECSFVWALGYSPDKYEEILLGIKQTTALYEKTELDLKESEEKLEEIRSYTEVYRFYTSIRNHWPILEPFWNYLVESDIIFDNPKMSIVELGKLRHDLETEVKIEVLTKEMEEFKKLKSMSEQDDQTNIDKLTETLAALEAEMLTKNRELTFERENIRKLEVYKEIAIDVRDMSKTLEEKMSVRESIVDELMDNVSKQAINKMIQEVQLDLAQNEQRLSEVNMQRALVVDIQNQISKLSDEEDDLKVLTKELSPTDGLIAEGLLGFINSFISQMNSFIKKIWLYPLAIQPCKVNDEDEFELDYKFALQVNDSDNIIPDINKASSAMREVIDLAFKVVSMKYLKLSDSPMFLDEFGRTFDHAHRSAALHVITNLMTQSSFPQLFLISHYEESYGSLKNAEVTVLCGNNIVIPKGSVFNQHVVME